MTQKLKKLETYLKTYWPSAIEPKEEGDNTIDITIKLLEDIRKPISPEVAQLTAKAILPIIKNERELFPDTIKLKDEIIVDKLIYITKQFWNKIILQHTSYPPCSISNKTIN